MSNLEFRCLRADEIECKATPSPFNNTIEISLHVRAETCTQILNETVGAMNWKKSYAQGNKNCIVEIWDSEKKEWVSKEDCGGGLTEVDGYKGQASNGFKRACALGWGLGIELYSQPYIAVPMTSDNTAGEVVTEKYHLSSIKYDGLKIVECTVVDSHGNTVWPVSSDCSGPADVVVCSFEKEDAPCEPPEVLNDNTDGFDEDDVIDYQEAFRAEIKRTHVKLLDVLQRLKIDSIEKIDQTDHDIRNEVLNKLKLMPTYKRASKGQTTEQ